MRIADRLRSGPPCFSFEFFPPKSEEGVTQLFTTLKELADLQPGFVSVTYGAGGSTRQLTIELTSAIKRETGIEAMAHLTCVGHGRTELAEILERLKSAGVANVLALRGDPPKGETAFVPVAGGFRYASELVAFIRQTSGDWFHIEVACYPEYHPQTRYAKDEIRNFKKKVDAGANSAITQYFYNADAYFRFVEECRAAGISIPIVPGVMPIGNFAQLARFSDASGAEIPRWMRLKLEGFYDDAPSIRAYGLDVVAALCEKLLAGGAPGLHFYTLNQATLSAEIWRRLKL
jgi:methylenetetrahydrofolate reductase (NADPH)